MQFVVYILVTTFKNSELTYKVNINIHQLNVCDKYFIFVNTITNYYINQINCIINSHHYDASSSHMTILAQVQLMIQYGTEIN